MHIRNIPIVDAARCGSRVSAFGEGFLLHRSRGAVNLQFGSRVITLQAAPGILSPSSVIVGFPVLPDVAGAYFSNGVISTDTFAVRIGKREDLRFRTKPGFDAGSALSSLGPLVRPYDRSIMKPMLAGLYGCSFTCGGLEKDIVARQMRAFKGSRSLPELARGLLGTGFGLTPSGDDFVLGMIAACRLAGKGIPGIREIIGRYDNPFPRTILEDACRGFFSEPLLVLMDRLSAGECAAAAAGRLLNVGSTSGRDTIAGMYYALCTPGLSGNRRPVAGPGGFTALCCEAS